MARELTLKQADFVLHYVGDCKGNATEAASRAGYKGNREQLRILGCQNLTKINVKQAIDAEKAKKLKKNKTKIQKWLEDVEDTETRAKSKGVLTAEQRAQDMRAKHLGSYEQDNLQKTGDHITQIAVLPAPERKEYLEGRIKALERQRDLIEVQGDAGDAIAEG